jgi:hypothetical protein
MKVNKLLEKFSIIVGDQNVCLLFSSNSVLKNMGATIHVAVIVKLQLILWAL